MRFSREHIIKAARADLTERYKGFPPELKDEAIESLVPLLEKLPRAWYESLPHPPFDNDRLITETVRMALSKLRPDLVDEANRK